MSIIATAPTTARGVPALISLTAAFVLGLFGGCAAGGCTGPGAIGGGWIFGGCTPMTVMFSFRPFLHKSLSPLMK